MTTDVERVLKPGEQVCHLAAIHCTSGLLILIVSLAVLILAGSGV